MIYHAEPGAVSLLTLNISQSVDGAGDQFRNIYVLCYDLYAHPK